MKVISIIGFSNSGKTSLITQLVELLTNQGYRVGVVKHSDKKVDLDKEGKDSWRIFKAGYDVAVLSPVKFAYRARRELSLIEILRYFEDYDYVFVEGFKSDIRNGIAVVRSHEELDELLKQIDQSRLAGIYFRDEMGVEVDGFRVFNDVNDLFEFIIHEL
ncbi:molybdopterin-guanine dinucleotide biosynthesis protein MobB [Archaeoglobus sulfaticallidus PM70-1]|uniref:Molybdopterin-guanine dinucleotide biosynthesis protein MobB n=1 Tax=Archaeoglobus sulfaticallidus PM70-1 TaxID=387631 RepID=N0BMY1_9EURY|nr:molybdopterin-guanine dinucleotide biosynthesis protein B [Archaeoglobus sulfaticallidus]AGK61635.1 molybdopterin-guanine dinucleotide biosynthesis protein MobB [Archaeoglobus sulfaticallidus PM70-1]